MAERKETTMAQVVDPVCGMTVDSQNAAATAEYQGQTYSFCCPGCKKAFEKDQARYLQQQGDQSAHQHKHWRSLALLVEQ
jgi:YHS domain-containing protein